MRKRKGQSILEYVIIFAAIVAAVIIGSQYIKSGVDKGMNDTAGAMTTATGKLLNIGN